MAKSKTLKTRDIFLGQRLRLAREQSGLSVSEIADSLNLTKTVIEYLESDHYKSSNMDVFYIGYLRAYAEILNLPGDELVISYKDIVGNDSESIKMVPKYNIAFQESTVQKILSNNIKIITSVTLIIVLSVVGSWWHKKYHYKTTDSTYSTVLLDVAEKTIEQTIETDNMDLSL